MSVKPRIVHLCSNRWNSAITEYCLRLAQALSHNAYDNLILCLDQGFLFQRAHKLGLEVQGVENFEITQILKVRRLVAEFKPDVLICYGGKESFLAKFLSVKKKIRFIGDGRHQSSFLKHWLASLSLRTFEHILYPSSYLKDLLNHKRACSVIPIGSDEQTFHYSPQISKAIRPEVLLVGRLDPVKGHKDALSMFSWLLKAWPDGEPRPFLRIIGKEANIRLIELEAHAEYLGLRLDNDVFFNEGDCEDLPERMRAASLGLISSLDSELICRVGVEFLLSGVPVYVSGVGSLAELVEKDRLFGSHYKDLTAEQRVFEFARILRESWQEDQAIREARSQRANELFSLDSMKQLFVRI
jgi:glycosyltransferase involved in cell wall biosynthesis